MRKKTYLLVIIFLICFLVSGCGGPTRYQRNIYNNDASIISDGDSYYSKYLNVSNNIIELDKYTGSYTLWKKSLDKSSTIYIYIKNNISNGKYKIVLIKENTIYKTIETYDNKKEQNISYNIESGSYKIKIIGINTTGDIKYDIK